MSWFYRRATPGILITPDGSVKGLRIDWGLEWLDSALDQSSQRNAHVSPHQTDGERGKTQMVRCQTFWRSAQRA